MWEKKKEQDNLSRHRKFSITVWAKSNLLLKTGWKKTKANRTFSASSWEISTSFWQEWPNSTDVFHILLSNKNTWMHVSSPPLWRQWHYHPLSWFSGASSDPVCFRHPLGDRDPVSTQGAAAGFSQSLGSTSSHHSLCVAVRKCHDPVG